MGLYGTPGQKLPAWCKNYPWQPPILFTATRLFPEDCRLGFSEFQDKEFAIRISSPERAALEMCYHVPGQVGFDEALLIAENLITLRPAILQPDWDLLGLGNFEKLPAVCWKLLNIRKMAPAKRQQEVTRLRQYLAI